MRSSGPDHSLHRQAISQSLFAASKFEAERVMSFPFCGHSRLAFAYYESSEFSKLWASFLEHGALHASTHDGLCQLVGLDHRGSTKQNEAKATAFTMGNNVLRTGTRICHLP